MLRNGKAKKTDPPIPADFAPISGKGKRAKRFEDPQDAPVLETIRFRYSTEAVVEEPEPTPEEVVPETPETPQEAPAKSRNRRNRRNRGQKNPADKEKKEQPQKKEQPAPKEEQPAQEGDVAPKKSNRRNHHRRRKPRSSGAKSE